MKVLKLSDMHRGWFVGNFNPSIWKTDYVEIGVLTHKKDEKWPKHYHKVAIEHNVLLEGSMTICGTLLSKGDIFTIDAGEVADPIFHEDCKVLCIKSPSLPNDKYEVI
jgi:quercetin dioxygenase-like cupin family protein